MFPRGQKFAYKQSLPDYIISARPEIVEIARQEVLHRAFLLVADQSLSEYGVNIKTSIYVFDDYSCGYATKTIGAVVEVSTPKEQVVRLEDQCPYEFQPEYICIWCGAKSPYDDKFHSGTCENCGGPKI